jgi:hypothetical protein
MVLYGKLPINLMGGETAGETGKIDWLSDVIKVALFAATYTPAQDTDELYSGISANEVANGNGYTTGGNTAASATVAYTAGTNLATFDAADPATWTASGAGFAFRYAVTYDSTTGLLIGYNDYGSTLTLNVGDTFTLTFDAAGIFTTTVP